MRTLRNRYIALGTMLLLALCCLPSAKAQKTYQPTGSHVIYGDGSGCTPRKLLVTLLAVPIGAPKSPENVRSTLSSGEQLWRWHQARSSAFPIV